MSAFLNVLFLWFTVYNDFVQAQPKVEVSVHDHPNEPQFLYIRNIKPSSTNMWKNIGHGGFKFFVNHHTEGNNWVKVHKASEPTRDTYYFKMPSKKRKDGQVKYYVWTGVSTMNPFKRGYLTFKSSHSNSWTPRYESPADFAKLIQDGKVQYGYLRTATSQYGGRFVVDDKFEKLEVADTDMGDADAKMEEGSYYDLYEDERNEDEWRDGFLRGYKAAMQRVFGRRDDQW